MRLLIVLSGRTGRIGHRGLATSFLDPVYDEAIASVLTRTLLETKQEVPEFLQMYVPEGDAAQNLRFETESDYDPSEAQGEMQTNSPSGDQSWGGGQAENANGSSGWGQTDSNTAASNGFERSGGTPAAPANNARGGEAAATSSAPVNSGWGNECAATAAVPANNGWGAQAQAAPAGW